MKIAIISEFSVPHFAGGGEQRYYEIAKRLVKKGHEVTWITMRQKNAAVTENFEGVKIVHLFPRIKNPPRRNIIQFFIYQITLFFHLLVNKYDVVDCQPFNPLFPAFIATKIRRTKFVATIHDIGSSNSDQWMKKSRLHSLERFLYKLPYKTIITVSSFVKQQLIANNIKSKIVVVHNGIDTKYIEKIVGKKEPVKKWDLIFVGRNTPHKHPEDFIEVVKKLNIKGAIIGEGFENYELAKNNKNISLLGKLESYEKVIQEIKKAKILVLPSTREGFGLVVAEANACQVPAIAYNKTGVEDVIINDKTGFLVEQRDVNALAIKVQKILKDNSLRKKMGISARKHMGDFSWDKTAKYIEKAYEDAK